MGKRKGLTSSFLTIQKVYNLINHKAYIGVTNGTRFVAVISIYAEEPPF
jgi:hypothetical protein